MTVTTISTQSQLLSALSAARAGDTILLADGHYGALSLNKMTRDVTIAAVNPGAATFDGIEMRATHGLSFEGIAVTNTFRAWYGSSDIGLANSSAKMLYFKDVDGLEVTGNNVADGTHGVVLNSISNFVIRDNTILRAGEDLMRITGDSWNGLIENNVLFDAVAGPPKHPDMIQIFAVDGQTPHDITIRGNHIYDDGATGGTAAQGIFIAAPGPGGFRNFLIEDNLIAVNHPNSIYVSGGQENFVIRNNSLMANSGDGGGIIRLAKGNTNLSNEGVEVYDNLAKLINKETPAAHVGENYFYGRGSALEEIFSGSGANLADFMPANGDSPANAFGALGRLAEWSMLHSARPALAAPVVDEPELVFSQQDPLSFVGNINRTKHFDHTDALELDEGTIALTFNASVTGWRRGIFSKDAAGLQDGFSVHLDQGSLVIKFEDENGAQILTKTGVSAKTSHDFVASFGDGVGKVWLDGALVGEVKTQMDWHGNAEDLMIGAQNAISTAGTTDQQRYAYSGTIRDLAIYDQAMTPEELHALAAENLPLV